MGASVASKWRRGPQSYGAPVDTNQNLKVEGCGSRSPAPNSACQVESSVYSVCNARVVQCVAMFTRYSVDCVRRAPCAMCRAASVRRVQCVQWTACTSCAVCTVDSVAGVHCVQCIACAVPCAHCTDRCVQCAAATTYSAYSVPSM